MARNTPIKIAVIKNKYIPEKGSQKSLEKIMLRVGDELTDTFYCEWNTHYGALAIAQQQQGVIESATVKMTYTPTIALTLRNNSVLIYKGAIEDENHTFVLNSSVEDIREAHHEIEFQVKRLVKK